MRRLDRRGGTLVELAIALLVTGMIVMAGHAGLSTISDRWLALRSQWQGALTAAAVRDQLTAWIRGAVLLPETGAFSGRHHFSTGQSLDELTFVTGDGGALRPGPHRVHLWLGRDGAGAPAGLLAELTPIEGLGPGIPDTLLLAPGATALSIRYLIEGPRGEQWQESWESTERLPRALRLELGRLEAIRLGRSVRRADDGGLPALLRLPFVVPVAMEEE